MSSSSEPSLDFFSHSTNHNNAFHHRTFSNDSSPNCSLLERTLSSEDTSAFRQTCSIGTHPSDHRLNQPYPSSTHHVPFIKSEPNQSNSFPNQHPSCQSTQLYHAGCSNPSSGYSCSFSGVHFSVCNNQQQGLGTPKQTRSSCSTQYTPNSSVTSGISSMQISGSFAVLPQIKALTTPIKPLPFSPSQVSRRLFRNKTLKRYINLPNFTMFCNKNVL